MNGLDYGIIAALAFFTLMGFRIGLVRGVITIGGMLFGVFLAGQYYERVAEVISGSKVPDRIWFVVAFILIFVVILVIAYVLAAIARSTINVLFLSFLDSWGGGFLGLVEGGIICEAILIVMATYPTLRMEKLIDGSRLAPWFLERLPYLLSLLPSQFDIVRDFL
ncbi:MAG: CvpA family protein [Chloroflexi bacterium]|nr:CvpA family protein [Chloroflexota bacterium]